MVNKTHIVRQAERLKRGEINRRRFIMAAMATGVTLPTATSLAQKAEAAQPRAGGVLRIGAATPQSLADTRALATGNTLLEIGADGRLIGDLAAEFAPSRGAQRWVFKLHRDVLFHDGTPLDASAAVASLAASDTPGIRHQIKGIRVDDPETIIIDLLAPNHNFAWVLSDPALTIRTPSGAETGAYRPSNDGQILKRVANHWKSGHGHFDAVDIIPLSDPAARLTALLNGEIDLMDDVDPGLFALLDHTPDIRLVESKDASVYGFARLKGDNGAGRALNDVTDRRDLAQKVLLGHGRARNCGTCTLDPAPKTVRLAPAEPNFPGARDMLTLVERMAQDRDLSITIDTKTADVQADRLRLRPTLDWTLSEIAARWPDPTLDGLIKQARLTQSADETADLQEKALTHLEDQGHLYPLVSNDIYAHRSDLNLPGKRFDPHRITTRGWFA